MKKALSVIILLLAILFTAVACNSAEEPQETEAPKDVLELVKNGASEAKIIYPSGNSEERSYAKDIAKKIKEAFGVSIDCRSDNAEPADDSKLEILVGRTNRTQTAAALEKLTRINDYACEMSGNKLVLTGDNNSATQQAVSYFITAFLLEENSTELIFSPSDNHIFLGKYGVDIIDCAGTVLSEYTIVYPKDSTLGEYYTALNLRFHLYYNAGFNLPVVDDSTAATGKEILIGQTNRNKTPAPTEGKFSVSVKDGNLCVSANDFFGYLSADEYLTDTLFTKASGADILTADFSYTGDADTAPERAGDYRVMFNNVWGLCDDMGYVNRDEYALAFYLAYQPDVIGLNEYWDDFRKQKVIAEGLIEKGYVEVIPEAKTEVKGNHGNPESNVVPVFYNPKKLKVVDSLYIHYTWYKDDTTEDSSVRADDSKGLTIVVFEGLDENGNGNGERFIIANTHFTSNYISKTHGYNSRLLNIETCWNELQPFIEAYPDASVILGCDYNARINSDECKKLLGYGFKSCHDTADVADDQQSHHSYPIYSDVLGFFTAVTYNKNSSYTGSIDHIFEYGNTVDAKLFDTLLNDYTASFSDHSPLLLDFNVIKNSEDSQ